VAAAAPVAEATPTTAEPAPEPDTAPAAESPPSAPPPAASPTGSPEPETPAPEPASAPAAESAQPEAASAPAKPRVLLVDDHADARRALREGLVAEGLRVLEAADGETALEYIRRVRPDIVVLELALPRLDGFGVLRAVGEGQVPRVPCVVLTVQDDPDVASWASELGASDYLVKPLAARALAERLRSRLAAG
jgi:PleD family two-component response regulator